MARFGRSLGLFPFLSFLLLLQSAPAALAQYMYLDTNGDGVHTSADVLSPSGTTSMDLWLRTNENRDGSTATCDTDDGDLTISAYEVVLHASNGTITWGAVTNRIAAFNVSLPTASNATDLHAGAYGAMQPAGAYLLATIVASPAGGTPAIEIATRTELGGAFMTTFGSLCSGLSFANTLELGFDWFDADGVPYGGIANHVPTIDPIPDLTVHEGSSVEQTLVARDADGNALTFTKTSGPAFVTVTTTDPGSGIAAGLLRVTPGFADAGRADASVRVTDGIASADAEARIFVVNENRAPVLEPLSDMIVFFRQTQAQDLYASDPDGGLLQFLLVNGPAFVSVTTLESGSPAHGQVVASPGQWDSGSKSVTVAVSDGLTQTEGSFMLTVIGLEQLSSLLLCRPYDMTVVAGQSAEQTIMATTSEPSAVAFSLVDTPPFVSISSVNSMPTPQTATLRVSPSTADIGVHSVTVHADDGFHPVRETCRITVVAAITPPTPKPELFTSLFRSIDVCDIPQGAVIADLNHDGFMDVVTANYGCGLSVLLGIGGGQFADRIDVHLDGNPKALELADIDKDGNLDAAVAIGFGDQIVVLKGDGTGAFQQVAALPAGPDAAYVAIADLNGDGILDLAGADEARNSISVYLRQDGWNYGQRRIFAAGSTPCFTAVADWNEDGIPDIAAANENSNAVTINKGIGGGDFQPAIFLGTAAGPSSVRAVDIDRDGHMDVVASGFHTDFLTVLFGDGHGDFPRRIDLQCGAAPWNMAVDDVNGDGHLDLVSANTSEDNVGVILGNGDGTFGSVIKSTTGFIPRFVATGDLNGDHRKDLVVANEVGGNVSILMGNGDGTFGSGRTLDGAPTSRIVGGDVTGDGVADLITVTLADMSLEVRTGLGGGQFSPPVRLDPGAPVGGIQLSDVNRDGIQDLLVTLDQEYWALYLGGHGFLTSPPIPEGEAGRAGAIEVGDWNRDSKPDVAISGSPPKLTLLDGDGAGGFSNPREMTLPKPINAMTSGDWDGDGITDLALMVDGQEVSVLWGDGAGFVPGPTFTTFNGASGVASGDADGDGRAELYVVEVGSRGGIEEFQKGEHARVAIYKWTSRDVPPSRTVYPGGSRSGRPELADVTGDGQLDLLVRAGGANAIGIMPGIGGGSFGPSQEYGVNRISLDYGVVDWDGDGRLDVAATNYEAGSLTLLRNIGSGTTPPLAGRAFVMPGDRTLRLAASKPSTCFYVEPTDHSFALSDVDLRSVRLSRADSDAEPIAAVVPKQGVLGDADRNGIEDMAVCFDRGALRGLFADLRGTHDVPLVVSGSLAGGREFRAEITLRVVTAPGGPPVVSVFPNPFNPSGSMQFTLDRPGRLRVTVHDVQGRTIARLVDTKTASARDYRLPLGGRGMASGIYFYRVETEDGVRSGRFTVLK
jgi:hypothetical protein